MQLVSLTVWIAIVIPFIVDQPALKYDYAFNIRAYNSGHIQPGIEMGLEG